MERSLLECQGGEGFALVGKELNEAGRGGNCREMTEVALAGKVGGSELKSGRRKEV